MFVLKTTVRTIMIVASATLAPLLLIQPASAQGLPPPLLPNQVDGAYLDSLGVIIYRALTDESHEFFDAILAMPAPAGFSDATVYLPEDGTTTCTPGSTDLGSCSDGITIRTDATDATHIDAYFLSGGASPQEDATFFSTVVSNVVIGPTENGQWQDISSDFGVSAQTFWVQSDLDIPEPTSLTLLGMGLVGLFVLRRKYA